MKEMPNRPNRENYPSDKAYLKAIVAYKKARNIYNQVHSPQDLEGKTVIAKIKNKRIYRKKKDSEFKKEQLASRPPKPLTEFIKRDEK